MKNYMSNYPAAEHVITGKLRVVSGPWIRQLVPKGPKYRFPNRTDFSKCREEIVSAMNDFGTRWYKRESMLSVIL